MRHSSGLLTDLYELAMAAGYVQTGIEARATFELFVRTLPPRRNFLVVAGLEQAIDFLQSVRFTVLEIEYLRRHPAFQNVRDEFFQFLTAFRFTGDVWAMREGTVAFPGEPLLRVTAPIAEGQIVETFLLSTISFQTMIATKAARVVTAAAGRPIIEFGSRRAHGPESGVLAARAAYVGGCQGTSNVLAGERFGVPTFGTQAHSWIMAFEDEGEAFSRFLDVFPEHATLLVDTYDVRGAVERILAIGRKPRGVRLDSGDLVADSRWVRERLNRAGWNDVQVFASGDLEEDRIARLIAQGAQIDAFGVGTALATSSDAPALGVIYKLVEVERGGEVRNAAKFSEAKITYPGRKQVFRTFGPGGRFERDTIALHGESLPGSEPLLVPVMRSGERLGQREPLSAIREHGLQSVGRLPEPVARLDAADPYPVDASSRVQALMESVRSRQFSPGPPRKKA